jgi:hypothetical protein
VRFEVINYGDLDRWRGNADALLVRDSTHPQAVRSSARTRGTSSRAGAMGDPCAEFAARYR